MRPEGKVRKFRLSRGRKHTPKPPPDPPCPLSVTQLNILGEYNSEVRRGIIHTGRWDTEMAAWQRQYDAWRRKRCDIYNRWALEQSGLEPAVRERLLKGLEAAS